MSNIKLFESKQIRSVWNDELQKWYFSVQDVVEVLTGSADVKQYIKKLLSRDGMLKTNWGTICTLVEMQTIDGKKRKVQASDTKGLLRIKKREKQIAKVQAHKFACSTNQYF